VEEKVCLNALDAEVCCKRQCFFLEINTSISLLLVAVENTPVSTGPTPVPALSSVGSAGICDQCWGLPGHPVAMVAVHGIAASPWKFSNIQCKILSKYKAKGLI